MPDDFLDASTTAQPSGDINASSGLPSARFFTIFSAKAEDSASSPSSASSAKPQWRCAAASAGESSALVGGAERSIRPDGDPLRMLGRRVGLEVTELLLLLGIQPTFTTRLFWRLVKAAVFAGHARSISQT